MEVKKRQPCNRLCDCVWGSKVCFIKRGYIWNYALHQWSRDENGKCHRTLNKDCNYEIEEYKQMTLEAFL